MHECCVSESDELGRQCRFLGGDGNPRPRVSLLADNRDQFLRKNACLAGFRKKLVTVRYLSALPVGRVFIIALESWYLTL